MLRFQRAPDAVFQAILRESLSFASDIISDMRSDPDPNGALSRETFVESFPVSGKVFPPRLAVETLRDMLQRLDRPEIYYLNDYHYLLLYDVLNFLSEIHNDRVSMAGNKRERKEASFVDPFFIEKIDFDEIVGLYFFDIDFLTSPEVMLNLPSWFKETYNPEAFALSQGLLPHPEELALKVDTIEDPLLYKVTLPRYFGTGSKVYPDYDYYEKTDYRTIAFT
jgi:hypothetical protein